MAVNRELINRGSSALCAVKHCQDKMNKEMRDNDFIMRNTPPLKWTEEQVMIAEACNIHINEPKK